MVEIKNITKNVGVIPIEHIVAKMKTSYHTLVIINLNLENFIDQINNVLLKIIIMMC